MKKTNTILITSILILATIMGLIVSCSSNQVERKGDNAQCRQTIEEQYEACRLLANYHSITLETIYQKNKSFQSEGKRFIDIIDISLVTDQAYTFLLQQLDNDAFCTILQRYSSSFPSSETHTRVETLSFEDSVEPIFDRFVNKLSQKCNIDQVRQDILSLLKDSQISDLTESERKVLLTRLALFDDSYSYWYKNYPKWVLPPSETKFDFSHDPTLYGWNEFWKELKRVAKADAKGPKAEGIISAATGGAAGGAVAGSIAGGIGAGPGAAGGAVVGATTEIVVSAVEASIKAASDRSAEKKPGNNNGSQNP